MGSPTVEGVRQLTSLLDEMNTVNDLLLTHQEAMHEIQKRGRKLEERQRELKDQLRELLFQMDCTPGSGNAGIVERQYWMLRQIVRQLA